MKRRDFMALTGAVALVPFAGHAAQTLEFSPGMVRERLAAGETLFVDFKADWCSTCRVQERVVGQLRGGNAAYDDAITFINVDWDKHGRGPLASRLRVPRRSTLVVLKGDDELGRVVAGTSQRVIQNLMDVALTAATS